MNFGQRRMARHALGLPNDRNLSYRNCYVAAIGGNQAAAWDSMVRSGMAERGKDGAAFVGFCLTEKGARLAIAPDERLESEDFPAAQEGTAP